MGTVNGTIHTKLIFIFLPDQILTFHW